MTDTLTIRPEPPDQPDVIALIEALDAQMTALYPPESNHLLDIAALSDPAVTFLVVRDGDEVVGCGALLRDPRGWGEVKRMFVRSEQRGRGIGKRVLAELETIARTRGCRCCGWKRAFTTSMRSRSIAARGFVGVRGVRGLRAGPVERVHGKACRTVWRAKARRAVPAAIWRARFALPARRGSRGACRVISHSMT